MDAEPRDSDVEIEITASGRSYRPPRQRPRPAPERQSPEPLEEDIEPTLRKAHEVLLRFPMATQAAFSALVAEGRAFAQTAEGAELLRRLARSSRAHRARVIWEILTLSGITEQRTEAIPSLFLDKLARALVMEKLEPMLARLFEREG